MAPQKTVTLTWTKLELEMIVHSLSRCLPRTALQVSSEPVVICCPTCAAELQHLDGYCSECGQCIDQEADIQWAEQLSEKSNENMIS